MSAGVLLVPPRPPTTLCLFIVLRCDPGSTNAIMAYPDSRPDDSHRGDLNDRVIEPSPGLPILFLSFVDPADPARPAMRAPSTARGISIAETFVSGECAPCEQVHVMSRLGNGEHLHRPSVI